MIKQLFWHGRNLGMFVCIYKAICFILRRAGVRGGIESWIAGFVGGYYGFGESKVHHAQASQWVAALWLRVNCILTQRRARSLARLLPDDRAAATRLDGSYLTATTTPI